VPYQKYNEDLKHYDNTSSGDCGSVKVNPPVNPFVKQYAVDILKLCRSPLQEFAVHLWLWDICIICSLFLAINHMYYEALITSTHNEIADRNITEEPSFWRPARPSWSCWSRNRRPTEYTQTASQNSLCSSVSTRHISHTHTHDVVQIKINSPDPYYLLNINTPYL